MRAQTRCVQFFITSGQLERSASIPWHLLGRKHLWVCLECHDNSNSLSSTEEWSVDRNSMNVMWSSVPEVDWCQNVQRKLSSCCLSLCLWATGRVIVLIFSSCIISEQLVGSLFVYTQLYSFLSVSASCSVFLDYVPSVAVVSSSPPVMSSGPILRHVLESELLEKVCSWCTINVPAHDKLRMQQLRLFELIISQSKQLLLIHRPVIKPLLRLLIDVADSPGEISNPFCLRYLAL